MNSKSETLLDILHIYCSEVVAQFPPSAKNNLYKTGFFWKLKSALSFIGRHIKEQSGFDSVYKEKILHELNGKDWLFVLGTNNINSIEFIKDDLPFPVYVSPYRFKKQGVEIIQLRNPNRFLAFLKDIVPLFQLLIKNKKQIRRCWDAGFRAAGSFASAVKLFENCRPNSILFSNDHTIEARSYLLAARSLNIPTFFIQHACVRPDFPPLKFSLSLLEGEDALNKYKQSGPVGGLVKLIGVPRLDNYLSSKNNSSEVKRIGICSNTIDSLESIERILDSLQENFPDLTLTYRPHPSDKRQLNLEKDSILYSNSRKENPFEFLLQQDLIIAGNTSIHYEAAILNVVSVYFKFDQGGATDDMYDFVKNGLVNRAESIEELIKIIKRNLNSKDKLSDKANYYHALLGTAEEGESEKIATKAILNFLQNKPTVPI